MLADITQFRLVLLLCSQQQEVLLGAGFLTPAGTRHGYPYLKAMIATINSIEFAGSLID
jgi:hypothetical protein